jgi:hypothetical protein
VFAPVEVHEDLALEHVHRLVRLGVGMQRRHLPLLHPVLEEEEGAVGLRRPDLPGVVAAAEEPATLAVVVRTDDRGNGGGIHVGPAL